MKKETLILENKTSKKQRNCEVVICSSAHCRFFPSYSLPMKKKWMKNENGWLAKLPYLLSLARKHCVRAFLRNARKIKIKTSRSNPKHAKKKVALFEEQKSQKTTSLNKTQKI